MAEVKTLAIELVCWVAALPRVQHRTLLLEAHVFTVKLLQMCQTGVAHSTHRKGSKTSLFFALSLQRHDAPRLIWRRL
jgi:hypothetical protein